MQKIRLRTRQSRSQRHNYDQTEKECAFFVLQLNGRPIYGFASVFGNAKQMLPACPLRSASASFLTVVAPVEEPLSHTSRENGLPVPTLSQSLAYSWSHTTDKPSRYLCFFNPIFYCTLISSAGKFSAGWSKVALRLARLQYTKPTAKLLLRLMHAVYRTWPWLIERRLRKQRLCSLCCWGWKMFRTDIHDEKRQSLCHSVGPKGCALRSNT